MSIEELENRITNLEKRVDVLEGKPPSEPEITPPVEPPRPDYAYDFELDMTVSRHIDFNIDAGETKICRFIFTKPEGQSYSHITAVLMATGPCIRLEIDEYGYQQKSCREETSESVATDSKYTDWVVPKHKYIYLRVINDGYAGRVRLRWNGENVYDAD